MKPPHVQRYIEVFERLEPSMLQALTDCFAEQARFVDPFNDVRGSDAIRQVFEHMFATCDDPRFGVDECIGDEHLVYLRWRFNFGSPGSRRTVLGVSRVQFAPDGLVTEHRDYWDPASQLYETLPILGRLFRALRHRLGAPQNSAPKPTQVSVTDQRKQT